MVCGRFVSSSPPDELAAYFGVDAVAESVLEPSWNVAPTKDVYAVLDHDGQRYLDAFHWGLVPSWAKDAKIASKLINARAETLGEKPAFRTSFRSRRCIVPASGFYEWRTLGGTGRNRRKQPMFIAAADGSPLAFAGLWSVWRGPDKDQEPLRSTTIVTTTPNATMAPIHDRMPVILPRGVWDRWLDPELDDPDELAALCVPADEGVLVVHPVATTVNSVRNDGPELIEEVPAEPVEAAPS